MPLKKKQKILPHEKRRTIFEGKAPKIKNNSRRIIAINKALSNMPNLQSIRINERHRKLSSERTKLLDELKKITDERTFKQIYYGLGLETEFERKIRISGKKEIKKAKETKKEKRSTFSQAKKELLKDMGLAEKDYKLLRKKYLELNLGELAFSKRMNFAEKFASLKNITFRKAMAFTNFAQRYPGMFKVRK